MKNPATHSDEPYKAIALLLAGALLLSPLLYFEALFTPSELPRYVMITIVAIVLSALLIIKLWHKPDALHWHPINLVIGVFALLTTASGLWALDSGGYYLSIIPFIALIIIYFASTQLNAYTPLLLGITLIAAVYAAIIGLLQSHNLSPLHYRDADVMGSTFFYKNHAALYFDLVIPASLSLILITKNRWLRWGITLASAICLSYLLETHTRGSWLGLGISVFAVIVLLLLQKTCLTDVINAIKKVKFELLAIVLIASTTLYSPSQMDESWNRKSYYGEQLLDTSSSTRLLIYNNAISMLIDNPLGVGFGSFWKGFQPYMNHPQINPITDANIIIYRAHSEPLQYFLELGLIGGFLVLFIFFYLMTIGIKTILSIEKTRDKILCLGIISSLLASALHGAIDFPLHKPSSALQFWVLAGLLVSFSSQMKPNIITAVQIKSALAVFGLLLCVFTPLALKLYYDYIPSSIHHQNAVLATDTDCATAITEIENSLDDAPYFFRTHNSRIDIYFKCVKDNNRLLPVLNAELAIDGANVKALLKRGYILLEQRNFDAAYKDFNKIKQLLPHRVYGKFGIAQTLLSSGNIQPGVIELKKIIEEHPEFKDAKKQLRDVEVFLENAKKKTK